MLAIQELSAALEELVAIFRGDCDFARADRVRDDLVMGQCSRRLFYRDDVRVISANTLGSAVVVNRGDGEAFVENLSRAIYSAEIPTIEVARQERICARVERQ